MHVSHCSLSVVLKTRGCDSGSENRKRFSMPFFSFRSQTVQRRSAAAEDKHQLTKLTATLLPQPFYCRCLQGRIANQHKKGNPFICLFRSRVFAEIDVEIENVLIGVENWSLSFCGVTRSESRFRFQTLRTLAPVFGPRHTDLHAGVRSLQQHSFGGSLNFEASCSY